MRGKVVDRETERITKCKHTSFKILPWNKAYYFASHTFPLKGIISLH